MTSWDCWTAGWIGIWLGMVRFRAVPTKDTDALLAKLQSRRTPWRKKKVGLPFPMSKRAHLRGVMNSLIKYSEQS
jgi:hypothetical protein